LDRDKKEAPEGTSLCFIEGSPVYDGFGQMGIQITFLISGSINLNDSWVKVWIDTSMADEQHP